MRVAVVQAPVDWADVPPSRLSQIAGCARQYGCEVVWCDLNAIFRKRAPESARPGWGWSHFLFWENSDVVARRFREMRDVVREQVERLKEADVVYFSVTKFSLRASLLFARRLKESAPKGLIVFGGPFFTVGNLRMHEFITNEPDVDVVLQGPGEFLFAKLLRDMKVFGRPNLQPGLHYRHGKELVMGDPVEGFGDMDALPFADFSGHAPELYDDGESIPIRLSRGQSFRCPACGAEEPRLRPRWMRGERLYAEVLFHRRNMPRHTKLLFEDVVDEEGARTLDSFSELMCQDAAKALSPAAWGAELDLAATAGRGSLATWARSGCRRVTVRFQERPLTDAEKRALLEFFEHGRACGMKMVPKLFFAAPGQEPRDVRDQAEFVAGNARFFQDGFEMGSLFYDALAVDVQLQHEMEKTAVGRSDPSPCHFGFGDRWTRSGDDLRSDPAARCLELKSVLRRADLSLLENRRETVENDYALMRNQIWRWHGHPIRQLEGLLAFFERESEDSIYHQAVIKENAFLGRIWERLSAAARLASAAQFYIAKAFNSPDWDPSDWEIPEDIGRVLREGLRRDCLERLRRRGIRRGNRVQTIHRYLLLIRALLGRSNALGDVKFDFDVPANRFRIVWENDDSDMAYAGDLGRKLLSILRKTKKLAPATRPGVPAILSPKGAPGRLNVPGDH